MGMSKFQLHLLQKIPKEPQAAITANELSKALWAHRGKAASAPSMRKKIINNLNRLAKIFPETIDFQTGQKEHRFRIKAEAPLLLSSMSQEEITAFGVLSKYGTELMPLPTRRVLQPFFDRAKTAAAEQAKQAGFGLRASRDMAGKWLEKIAVVPAVFPFVAPVIDESIKQRVHEAIFYERRLELEVRDPIGQAVTRCVVSPLALVQQGVRTYLIGKRMDAPAAERFALHRVLSASEASGHPEQPKDWSLDDFLRRGISHPVFKPSRYGALQKIELKVDASTQWLKETALAHNQTTHDLPEGGYVLKVTLPITEELVRWLLSMSFHVKVLSPKFLAQRLASDLRQSLEAYEEA
jgi:predicted DNA-binding transcriptional regulator YafY